MKAAALGFCCVLPAIPADGAAALPQPKAFIETHCASCHDDVEKKGGLALAKAKLANAASNFAKGVKARLG